MGFSGFFACGKADTQNSVVVTDLELDCNGFEDDDSDMRCNELTCCDACNEIS